MAGTYLFIETKSFTSLVKHYFGGDEAYADFQAALALDPDRGIVIAGASALRKIRWGDQRRGKGARGGLRVIYIHVPDLSVLFMLDVYGKDEADDLSRDEKRFLQEQASNLINELRQRHQRGRL